MIWRYFWRAVVAPLFLIGILGKGLTDAFDWWDNMLKPKLSKKLESKND
jgi:hypothetical protein